jgi:hypothetical protein
MHFMKFMAICKPPNLGNTESVYLGEIIAIKTDHVSIELALEMLQTDAVRQKIAEFKATSNRDPSLVFWMSYLDMVSTLLMFPLFQLH